MPEAKLKCVQKAVVRLESGAHAHRIVLEDEGNHTALITVPEESFHRYALGEDYNLTLKPVNPVCLT